LQQLLRPPHCHSWLLLLLPKLKVLASQQHPIGIWLPLVLVLVLQRYMPQEVATAATAWQQ
jgi:hypothetical protein